MFKIILSMSLFFLLGVKSAFALETQPILVLMSGFNSCNARVSPSQSMLPLAATQLEPTLVSLFRVRMATIPTLSVCFQNRGRFDSMVRSESNVPATGSTLAQQVGDIAAKYEAAPTIIIIGHSWGGMLALETAQPIRNWLQRQAQNPGLHHLNDARILLVTIDPIDYRFCGQPVLSNINNPACLSTPPSLQAGGGQLERETLGAVDAWVNVYQSAGRWLKSGPLESLGNLALPSGNVFFGLSDQRRAHIVIAEQNATWAEIGERVKLFVQ